MAQDTWCWKNKRAVTQWRRKCQVEGHHQGAFTDMMFNLTVFCQIWTRSLGHGSDVISETMAGCKATVEVRACLVFEICAFRTEINPPVCGRHLSKFWERQLTGGHSVDEKFLFFSKNKSEKHAWLATSRIARTHAYTRTHTHTHARTHTHTHTHTDLSSKKWERSCEENLSRLRYVRNCHSDWRPTKPA